MAAPCGAPAAEPPRRRRRPDLSQQVAKLEVVEHLRETHAIRGALADFRVDETECMVTFKGPGYAADAFIDRESGHYSLTQTYHGFIAVINDLHKGRDTGPVWSVVIDISAVLLTVISLTGLVLLFYLKLRRKPGVIVALLGTVRGAGAAIGTGCLESPDDGATPCRVPETRSSGRFSKWAGSLPSQTAHQHGRMRRSRRPWPSRPARSSFG